MEKISCDIIQDLIPSYVDELCSEDTRRLVEEHLRDCGECGQIVTLCRNNGVSAMRMEQKSLDGLRKIKWLTNFKDMSCYGIILFVLVWLMVWMLAAGYRDFLFEMTHPLAFTICVLLELLSGLGNKAKKKSGKMEYILGAISLVMDALLIGLFCYFVVRIRNGAETIFGVEVSKCGPLLLTQIGLIAGIQIAIWLFYLYGIIKQGINCKWLMCFNMMGCFLALSYGVGLHSMDHFQTVMSYYMQMTVEILIVGAVGIAANILISKAFKKK